MLDNGNVNHYIGYSLFNYSFKLVFDCGVVLHLKLGNPQGLDPVSHRKGVCRLHWMLIPGSKGKIRRISRMPIAYFGTWDQ